MIKECKTAVVILDQLFPFLDDVYVTMSYYYNRHIPEKQHLLGLNYHLGSLGQGPNSQEN